MASVSYWTDAMPHIFRRDGDQIAQLTQNLTVNFMARCLFPGNRFFLAIPLKNVRE